MIKRLTPGRIIALVVVLALLGGGIYLERSLYVAPEWPPPREGDPQPVRPTADDPEFHRTPFAETFEERRELYVEWATQQPTPDSRNSIWAELMKIEAGQDYFPEATMDWLLDFVNARNDCADFVVAGLIRLYYMYPEVLSAQQEQALRNTLLDFQYWLDEPNPDKGAMELWTENHQILIYTSEYLAGQLFPEETFTNNGMSGVERMENARPKIMRWIDWRVRTGFAEWDSIPYYPEDIASLANIVDFAGDEELALHAEMLLDLLLFDVAVDSFYGQFATSHGRASGHHVQSAAGDSMVSVQALLLGLGRFQSNSNMGVVSLALSENYRLPPVIEAVALDMPEEMINYERHSIPVTKEEAERRGLSMDSPEDIDIWWGMGAFTHPLVIDQTIALAGEWDLWHYPDFKDFEVLGKVLGRINALGLASRLLDPDPNGTLMSEVNKVSYRTPDYMLSNAQDYRPGEKGYQQHIWQATLGPYARVFVTNPDSLRSDGHRPSYWGSHGRLPRTAQHENVLVAVHKIGRYQGLLEARHFAFTHAYFPRWAFDEVVEVPVDDGSGWVFGCKDDGYVALYSHLPYRWQDEGIDADQEIIALGRENVWITQMGRRAVDGDFEDFVAAVSNAPLAVDDLQVNYKAPGVGEVEFGWEGPFMVDGQEVSLRDYPRWENPYTQAAFDSREFLIRHNGLELHLDFDRNLRYLGQEEN
ncbi:MAG: hypothetical protein FH749_13390 [Firmicutes bacterium]|nr:hypothetical protein [Bacillota bacterium]